ncbi:MAG: hypothetical protein KDD53_01790 [Bdellovibrionales bacterium]|nr:hypothetical protein [Bdellovibrionales bacterium]
MQFAASNPGTDPILDVPGAQPALSQHCEELEISPSLRQEALDSTVIGYALKRSDLVSASVIDRAALEKLDCEFALALKSNRELFERDPQLSEVYFRFVAEIQFSRRLEALENKAAEIGIETGIALGRIGAGEESARKIEVLKQTLDAFCQEHSDLFDRCEGLSEMVLRRFQDAQKVGQQMWLDAHHTAGDLFKELGRQLPGIHPRPERICNILSPWERSEREMQLVKEAFSIRYGDRIANAISNALPDETLFHSSRWWLAAKNMCLHTLALDRLKATADSLCLGLLSKEEPDLVTLRRSLGGFAPQEVAQVENLFNEMYSEDIFNRQVLSSVLPERVAAYLKVLKDQNSCEFAGDAYLVHFLSFNMSENQKFIVSLLNGLTDAQLDQVKSAHVELFGESLLDIVERTKREGPLHNLALALLGESRERAKLIVAHRLRCGLMGDLEGEISRVFYHQDEDDRRFARESYASVFNREFLKDVKSRVDRRRYNVVHSLVESGDVPRHRLIKIYIQGPGTDVNGVRRTIKHLPKEEIEKMKACFAHENRYAAWQVDFRNTPWVGRLIPEALNSAMGKFVRSAPIARWFFPKHPAQQGDKKNLRDELESELSGDDWFDIQCYLEGTPSTPCEWMELISKIYEHERSGILLRKVDFADSSSRIVRLMKFTGVYNLMRNLRLIAPDGPQMDNHFEIAKKFYETRIQGVEAPSIEDQTHFEFLARLCRIDFDAFRQYKILAAEHVSNLAAGGVSLAFTIGLAEAGAPLWGVIGSTFFAGIGVKYFFKSKIKGDGYTNIREFSVDTVRSLFEAFSLRAGAIGSYAVKALNNPFSQMAANNVVKFSLLKLTTLAQNIGRCCHLEGIVGSRQLDFREEFLDLQSATESTGALTKVANGSPLLNAGLAKAIQGAME